MAENLAAGLYASAAILLFSAILTTALRCYVRIVILKTFGVDDYLMLLALAFYTVYISWVFYGTHFNGGRHTVDIPLNAYSPSLMAFYMGEVFYVITAFTIKLSIGAFLLRLLKSKAQRTVVYVTLGVVTIYSIAYTFMTIFQCSPVDHYWHPTSPGTCFSTNLVLAVTYTHTVLLSFSDFLFAAMPIFLVWNLQMNLYMKISVAGLMSLGAIAGVTSIVRVVYIKAIAAQNDLFFESSKLIIWTNLEPGIGIIIGSAAALRPLFKTLLGKTTLFSSSRSRKYGTYGTGSRRRAGTGPWASNHDAHFQLESLKGEEAIGYSTKVNGGVRRSVSKKGIMGTGLGQSDNDSLEELRPTVEEGNILKQTTVERHVEIYDHDGSRAISPRPPPGHF